MLALACSTPERPAAARSRAVSPDTTLVYECDRGLEFVAAIRRDTMWAFLPSGMLLLPHLPADSGARYGASNVTLWMTGEEATIEHRGEAARTCRNNRARAVWEHAKLSGVDFRAVGNEPGWHVDIAADSIRLVTDYGQQRRVFPTPQPATNVDSAQTVYRTATGSDTLEIRLDRGPCHDTMSGEAFETAVTLVLGNWTLRGCGRALH